jgi:hypothetical protein
MRFEVKINRRAEEVWAYNTDFANEPEWQQRVVSSVPDPPGRARQGTRKIKVRRTPFGRQRFVVEVTRLDDAGREWDDVVVEGSVAGSTGHYRVVPTGEHACTVHLDVTVKAKGPARLLMPIIDATSRKDLDGGLQGLKQVLEVGRA